MLDDVTYIADPMQQQQPSNRDRKPRPFVAAGAEEEKEDLRMAVTGISTSAGLRPTAVKTQSLTNSFDIVDASSHSVASPYQDGSKASGGNNQANGSNLSDKVQSVQSYVIQSGSGSNSAGG